MLRIHEADVENLYRMFLLRGNRFDVRGDRVWLVAGEPLFNEPPCVVGGGWDEVLWPWLVERK